MTKLVIGAGVIALGAMGFACQKDESQTAETLTQIDQRLQRIENNMRTARPAGARARGQRRAPQRRYPDPKTVFSVPVDGLPYQGGKDAKVTIVEAFEFACPWCERVRPEIKKVLDHYGDDVRVVHKNFIVHPTTATVPALAGCAAGKQGKFHQMEELIWDKGFKAGRNLGRDNMNKLATELGLDMKKFAADIDGVCKSVLAKDRSELARVGTRGTPSIYINGRFYIGQRNFAGFKRIIDAELALAKKRKAGPGYYEQWVVKKGKKRFVPGV